MAGPIVAVCEIGSVWFYELEPESWMTIRDRFSKPLEPKTQLFWRDRKDACYATLMTIKHLRRLPEITCDKRDRRGWVILQDCDQPTLFS